MKTVDQIREYLEIIEDDNNDCMSMLGDFETEQAEEWTRMDLQFLFDVKDDDLIETIKQNAEKQDGDPLCLDYKRLLEWINE